MDNLQYYVYISNCELEFKETYKYLNADIENPILLIVCLVGRGGGSVVTSAMVLGGGACVVLVAFIRFKRRLTDP